MPATATLYATTATQIAGTWTNPTSAVGSPNATGTTAPTNCATWVNAARSTTATLELSGYDFTAAVGNATVNSVSATIPHAETSTANITALTAQLYSGATAIGAAVTVTRVTTLTSHTVTFPAAPTLAQLADLRVRITATRANNTTSSTEYIDAAGLAVTYTPIAKIDTFTDDFATADLTKWGISPAASVTGGQLLLPVNSSYSAEARSVRAYDLTSSEAVVELVQRPNAGTGTTEGMFYLYLDSENANSVRVEVNGSSLLAVYRSGGAAAVFQAATTFDATAHRWLRIREAGGTVYWDTSPDRSTWTNLTTWVPTFSVSAVYPLLVSGYYGTESSPGTLIFDNFNVAATASLTVKAARSASRSSRPLLTQSTALTVKGARAVTRASRPKLSQQQPSITVKAARSATRATRPLLTQAQTLIVRAARSTTRATRALLAQQQGTLTVHGARSTSRASRPLPAQQQPALTVPGARSATRAGRAPLAQHTTVVVAAARAQTRAAGATLSHKSPLTVAPARAASRAGDVQLAVIGQVAVRDARAHTTASAPLLTQTSDLAVHGARADTRAQAITLPPPAGILAVNGARAQTRASVPALEQLQLLTVAGARAPTHASNAHLTDTSTPTVPPERTRTVPADTRTASVASDDRTTTVPADVRLLAVATENRTSPVPAEIRTLLA